MNIEAKNGMFRGGRVPKAQTLKGYNQPDYDDPEDTQPFTDNKPGSLTPRKPGIKLPRQGGSKPKNPGSRATGWIMGIRKPKSADQLDRYFDSAN